MLPWVDLVILSDATQNMPACIIMVWLFSACSIGFCCEGFSPGQWPRVSLWGLAGTVALGSHELPSYGLLRVGAHWKLTSVSPLKAEDASCVLLPQSPFPPGLLCLPVWPSVWLGLSLNFIGHSGFLSVPTVPPTQPAFRRYSSMRGWKELHEILLHTEIAQWPRPRTPRIPDGQKERWTIKVPPPFHSLLRNIGSWFSLPFSYPFKLPIRMCSWPRFDHCLPFLGWQ